MKKDELFEIVMNNIAFDGWTERALEASANTAQIKRIELNSYFPNGLKDILDYLSKRTDEKTLAQAQKEDLSKLRVHEKITRMVQIRFEILSNYKDAIKSSIKLSFKPNYLMDIKKSLWQSANVMWREAGDTSTDYNHYTKRFLLSGVIKTTTLYWLNDSSENFHKTKDFLDKRIKNVLSVGKTIHKTKNFFQRLNPFCKEQ